MNESKFEELTNLYFDREISADELKCLKDELAANADRRREFQFRFRLHKATCSALSCENAALSEQSSERPANDRPKHLPSLALGFGMAACFLVLLATSIFFMREPLDNADTFVAELSNPADELSYAENQEADSQFQGSLSSKLRLAGLTPDISSFNQQLSRVDTEALNRRQAHLQDVIKRVNRYQTYSAIPETQLVESFERNYETSSDSYWPTGFKSSLASFK